MEKRYLQSLSKEELILKLCVMQQENDELEKAGINYREEIRLFECDNAKLREPLSDINLGASEVPTF